MNKALKFLAENRKKSEGMKKVWKERKDKYKVVNEEGKTAVADSVIDGFPPVSYQEKVSIAGNTGVKVEKSPAYTLKQELQQVEEGCKNEYYDGNTEPYICGKLRHGVMHTCSICETKIEYLQEAILLSEEYEKEIENLNKQIQVFALRYINADEEYFNSLEELELAEYNDVNKRIDFITKLRGKGK